ncbi:heavy-metal-associated domain-containing protein [Abyssalbus ytuae]|uniref:Heavy-metal-associated domain-containing protein n=1 Tax=Abyssalbus ytuae TaxID=2926907 RepID=A0A9E6ZQW3_9FLAO|nr:heavy-metal-associated domain-containing protein [Abyssalbus ytuae]UOB18900.1 heavy-metal-associated domain-containing protein [Abyssalbus ytuae]
MELISENVIPGNHGKIFATNAENKEQLEHIKKLVLEVPGIQHVEIKHETYPREFIVYTTTLVSIIEIEKAVNRTGLNAIPKTTFVL